MDEAFSKEMVVTEDGPIVSPSAEEELIYLVAKVKEPRLDKEYTSLLKQRASSYLDIHSEEFDNMTPDQIKILEQGIIKRAQGKISNEKQKDKIIMWLSGIGFLAFLGLGFFLNPLFFWADIILIFFFMRGLIGSDDEYIARNFLDTYETTHKHPEKLLLEDKNQSKL